MILKSQPIISTSFNGSDEYIILPYDNNIKFNAGQSRSFSCFFKTTTTPGVILSNLTSDSWIGNIISFDSSGKIAFQIRNGLNLAAVIITTASFNDDTEYHLVVTHTGSLTVSGMDIYINAVAQARTENDDDLPSAYVEAAPYNIGRNPGFASYYSDNLNNLAFWSRVLLQSEITSIFNRGRVNPDYRDISGLQTHLKLDALNPKDEIGTNHGTSVLMDSSNIIKESGNIVDNQGIIMKSQGADVSDNQGLKISII